MLQVSFTPFPVLESERLYLREITDQDVNEVFALRSDPATMRYIPRPLAKTQQDARDHISMISKGVSDNEFINWAIALKEDNKLIGMICLLRMQLKNFRTEIGYILHPDFHGKGIMDAAIKEVINYAFNTLKFHSIEAVIDPANSASEKVLLRNNFIKEGHLKENEFYDGRFLDTVIYSLINKNSSWR
ncbi:GNAT family N-acetyltransferase [Flavihumibacter sp. R14]|nr:GNAT family N-acetyltransferase [Flavihumibacter soli]